MDNELLCKFDKIFDYCFSLFKNKNGDYGPTWLIYRSPSLNDEIWRKAKRIRTLEEHNDNACIPEGRDTEYVGIINYCVMFLIRLQETDAVCSFDDLIEDLSYIDRIDSEAIYRAYQLHVKTVRELLISKNTDYGNAWKSMAITSMTDQIIVRVYRIRKILSNNGKCSVSEGITSQLYDIINYCFFALVKMDPEMFRE